MEQITTQLRRVFGKVLKGMALLVLLLPLGCTARYSHALAGPIPNETGTEVSTKSTGLSVFSIAFSEPTPAHEQVIQLLGACSSLNTVEVDYREKVFFVVGIPEVGVKAKCVK